MSERKSGFTIVELLVVISVIGVLMSIVTVAATSAIRQSREHKMNSMKAVLRAGIMAYYARNDEWPGALKSISGRNTDSSEVTLSDSEAQNVFTTLIEESLKPDNAPYLDVNGLFVAKSAPPSGAEKSREEVARGHDFKSAANRSDKRSFISTREMIVGYARKKSGYFRRFKISYNFETDSVSVHAQEADER